MCKDYFYLIIQFNHFPFCVDAGVFFSLPTFEFQSCFELQALIPKIIIKINKIPDSFFNNGTTLWL